MGVTQTPHFGKLFGKINSENRTHNLIQAAARV
jgi:hypothetical protein